MLWPLITSWQYWLGRVATHSASLINTETNTNQAALFTSLNFAQMTYKTCSQQVTEMTDKNAYILQ